METPQGDAGKVQTAVSNLTANGVKYTPRGSVSDSHVFNEQDGLRAEGHIAIESVVRDTGCGNLLEKPESLFREFERVDSSSHHKPGTRPRLGV